jgi:hypothetical protein
LDGIFDVNLDGKKGQFSIQEWKIIYKKMAQHVLEDKIIE